MLIETAEKININGREYWLVGKSLIRKNFYKGKIGLLNWIFFLPIVQKLYKFSKGLFYIDVEGIEI